MNVRQAHTRVMRKLAVLTCLVPTNVDVQRDIMEMATIHVKV